MDIVKKITALLSPSLHPNEIIYLSGLKSRLLKGETLNNADLIAIHKIGEK